MKIELNKRVLSEEIDPDVEKKIITNEDAVIHYNALKDRLRANFRKEIFHKVDNIRILKEIKDNEYYKLDGYKSFDAFIKNYNIAKTQAYAYLKLAAALQEGILKEDYLIENGIQNSLELIQNKESLTFKKSKQNPIKPLRFQLKTQESYDFYKNNAKFTSFMMQDIFENQKDWINKLLKKYKQLKG
ncbi:MULTISPECIES: chromosome replication/partitioning protein [Borreliella]|uniref:PF-49 protein n=5 Tax=Borreliella TaxID=64895 RepID=Q8GL17_BORBG|nr:chromosome replication/partitioning protein [Borreliella burgdorferi]AAN17909.1 PF-49 protein [Borreliella burgdorferi]ACK74287.1 putative plasmid partition protein [Borreliella burgdorferi ZS7]ACL34084.1 putative plasmid partition protein [Borreliella burgdorferi 156a]ADQ31412.1 PF-49 protein [Borreliella burgdorferi JD1]ADQ44452.1 PF-49 protein [Borreliella burgdorferi 297]